MKKYISFMIGCAAMAAPLAASAAFHELLQEKKIDARPAMRDQREEMKANAVQMKEDMKGEIKEMRGAMQEKMNVMRKEMQEKRDVMREEMKQKREDFKIKADERREALKKKIGEERAGRIEKFFAAMTEKFENAIDRLDKVADRLEDRISVSAAPAADMAVLQDKLIAAHAKITEASTALADAKAQYAEAVKGADLKVAFRKVHDIVQATAAKVKAAHQALVEAAAAINSAGAAGQGAAMPAGAASSQ